MPKREGNVVMNDTTESFLRRVPTDSTAQISERFSPLRYCLSRTLNALWMTQYTKDAGSNGAECTRW